MVYDLTLVSATFNPSGKVGQSLNGGRGDATGVIVNPPITVELWGKGGAVTGARVLCGRANSLWIGSSNNMVAARYGSGANEAVLATSIDMSDNLWHHYALVITPEGGTLFFDGVAVATSPKTPEAAGYIGPSGPNTFGIGNFGGGGASWGTGREADECRISIGARYTANFTPPSGLLEVDASTIALYRLDGDGLNAQSNPPSFNVVAPNHPAICYSPYNWLISSSQAKTINPGAYFKTTFSGNQASLSFDMNGVSIPLPQIRYRIDGFGPWTQESLASILNLVIPSETAAYQRHLLEVVVKSTTETQARWNTQSTAVKLTGIGLAIGESLYAPEQLPECVIFYGDSITEGVRTVNATATNDTDRNDATQGWAYQLGKMLGCEFGIVGFGGTGVAKASGSGGVPSLQVSFNQLWNGEPRSFMPEPKLIVINSGTNDSGEIISACTNLLNLLLASCPTAKIAVLQPFNGSRTSSWLGSIPACLDPIRVEYVNTSGFFPPNTSADNLHPYGWINMSSIAPKLYPFLRRMLNPPVPYRQRFF